MPNENPEKKKNTKTDEPIKSPFQFSERAQKVLRTSDIAEDMVEGFAATLAGFDHLDLKPDSTTLTAYMAGFTCTLKALGFPAKSAMRMTEEIALEIIKAGTGELDDDSPCGCPNCIKK